MLELMEVVIGDHGGVNAIGEVYEKCKITIYLCYILYFYSI
jgi:hypothetical protein